MRWVLPILILAAGCAAPREKSEFEKAPPLVKQYALVRLARGGSLMVASAQGGSPIGLASGVIGRTSGALAP